ncbi:MAG: hypothetical protein JNK29_18335 [Anaerolineales bacterium]|nr:hypothetical protein [Anaerolineales bacterium]
MLHHQIDPELRHQATAHLAQTMALLQMPTAELEASLQQELNANPALELVEELRCPGCGRRLARLPCPTCAAPRADEAPVVFLSPRQPGSGGLGDRDPDERPDEFEVRMRERLDEHILRQIAPALAVADRPIAAYLLARLDEDGLLPEAPAEAAAFLHVPLSAVQRVLGLIQRADPPGVGAGSPAESLLIQLDTLAESTPERLVALSRRLIIEHFEALARREYARIARSLQVPLARVTQAARFVQRNLTPYPARAFWGDGRLPETNEAVYREPDIIITQPRRGAGLMVEVLTPLAGWLRVNPAFKSALAECDTGEERERWQQAVERATLMTKCLQQRNATLQRLMGIIAVEQRGFIVGHDGDLRALTRARLAHTLGVHESTISRAVAGKAVALPNGRIVPMAKFFDRSLSVRDRVRVIVEGEPRPLTDDEIAARLAEDGVHIARRTVAKYRTMLGILPAHLRGRARPAARPSTAAQSANLP